jgi:hypothetical protein
MIDCPNVEMRDRLPDLANDTLVVVERDLVLAHLAECAACTSEIEILRTTRLIFLATTPRVNVAGIVSALPQYGVKSIGAAPSLRRSSWANSWRVAAAATFLAAGIGSYELLNKDSSVRPIDTIAAVTAPDTTTGLALTGALTEMSDDELKALASDIADIEALPSTEIETTTSRVAVPAIVPDSAVRDLEVR